MRCKRRTIGALVGYVHAVVAQEIIPIFPIRNSTAPTLKPTPTDSSCEAQCSVYYPPLTALQWVPEEQIVYTEKVLVGTISYVYVMGKVDGTESTLATDTRTVIGFVPPEYSFYQTTTDDAGTAVAVVPITTSDGVTFSSMTYPTPYVDYYTEYDWEGIVPTHNKAYEPICATAIEVPANAPLPQHPEYPQPKELYPGRNDPLGVDHVPIWAPIKDEPDKSFFDVAFPSESAFSYCSSMPRTTPLPTQYSAPRFIYDTTTVWTTPESPGIIKQESTVTGWEEQSTKEPMKTIQIPHLESTADRFEDKPTSKPGDSTDPNKLPIVSSAVIHIESTADGFSVKPPDALQTKQPDPPGNNNRPPPSIPDVIISIIKNNPNLFSAPPQITRPPVAPGGQFAEPTPVFTYVPTVINGQSTSIPAYILPGSGETATLGQTVTLNGQPTILAAPSAYFSLLPTIINGVATSVPAYIISGSITATLGQTVTIDGQSTVLSAPDAVFTMIPTTINGVKTEVPGYIISGSITATIGQTVTIDGTTTVLSVPTDAEGSTTGFEGPAQTPGGLGSQATASGGPSEGAAGRWGVEWSAALLGFGTAILLLL